MTRNRLHPERVGLSPGNWIAIVALLVTATTSVVIATVHASYTVSKDISEMRSEMAVYGKTLEHHDKRIDRVQNQIDELKK